jgi:hypothetical protein
VRATVEHTTTENISSSGCYFLLSQEPRVGTEVDLEVEMTAKPGGEVTSKMLCRGRVVRVDQQKATGKIGVGCVIDRYQIVPTQHQRTNTKESIE